MYCRDIHCTYTASAIHREDHFLLFASQSRMRSCEGTAKVPHSMLFHSLFVVHALCTAYSLPQDRSRPETSFGLRVKARSAAVAETLC